MSACNKNNDVLKIRERIKNWSYLYINLACLSVCLLVFNVIRLNRSGLKILRGTSRDPREGLWMIINTSTSSLYNCILQNILIPGLGGGVLLVTGLPLESILPFPCFRKCSCEIPNYKNQFSLIIYKSLFHQKSFFH